MFQLNKEQTTLKETSLSLMKTRSKGNIEPPSKKRKLSRHPSPDVQTSSDNSHQ